MNDELDRQAAELMSAVESEVVGGGIMQQMETVSTYVTNPEAVQDAVEEMMDIGPEQQESELAERDLEAELAEFEAEMSSVQELPTDDDILSQVTVALEAIWPDKWDVQLVGERYHIIIHFPHITVSNGKNMTTDIQDLYVKLEFNQANWTCATSMEGRRGTFTYPQYKSSYSHSHLPRSTGGSWGRFCLGSSEMSAIQAEWRMDGHAFDIIEFELWMYQLDAYVRWESLGGGPHIRMASISVTGAETSISDRYKSQALFCFVKVARENDLSFPLDYDKSTSRFTISEIELEKFILKHEELLTTYDNLIVPNRWNETDLWVKWDGQKHIYGNPDWVRIKRNIGEYNKTTSADYTFLFKGETIRPKILPYDAPDSDNLTSVPHPQLVKYIKVQLEQKTNNYFIKTYGK